MPLLRAGERVGRWTVGPRIGQGTFSEIFAGSGYTDSRAAASASGSGDGGSASGSAPVPVRCALKVDRPAPRTAGTLQWESDLLVRLQKYPFVPRHYGYLTAADGRTRVLAMQLLGNNISGLRKRQPDGATLPLAAAVHIVLQMLACVEAVHQEGFIHRDLKPSNFVVGATRPTRHQLFVLDFGQSRMYVDDRGGIRPAREAADFRGTSLYSSLHAHQLHDLGRRDDLWMLFYCFIDLARGGLPWRPFKDDRRACELCKAYYMAHPAALVGGLPGDAALLRLHDTLTRTGFADKPDYAGVAAAFKAVLAAATAAGTLYGRTYPPYPPVRYCAAIRHWYNASQTRAHTLPHAPAQAPELVAAVSAHRGTPIAELDGTVGGAGCNKVVAGADRLAEDSEVAAAFDMTPTPLTCDCVLECRGGGWGEWETDTARRPVADVLAVGPDGLSRDSALEGTLLFICCCFLHLRATATHDASPTPTHLLRSCNRIPDRVCGRGGAAAVCGAAGR